MNYDSTGLTDHFNRFSVTPFVIINPSPSRINIRIDQDSRDKKVHFTSYEIHSYQVFLFTLAFAWLRSHCCKNIVSTLIYQLYLNWLNSLQFLPDTNKLTTRSNY